jgi:hypothetical protein
MFCGGVLLKLTVFVVSVYDRKRTDLWQIPAKRWTKNHIESITIMAQYPANSHSLEFDSTYTSLHVVRNREIVQSFPLDGTAGSLLVVVENGQFILRASDPITEADLPHKYNLDEGAAASFSQERLGGVGIIDLSDMGRQGKHTVTYNLACGGVRLAAFKRPYGFWVKAVDPQCFDFDPD